ncbi:chaperone protein DnaJ-like isoform X1 [Gossypium australe]|uniref:Chaperone protein DnaJ-like isoform X1 n=1 Tax=Gossypium australe TaxID=47621 RepID=A0A5B6UY91_9ROSI|nr:chaperone protein DnaJ-like isoform X1 [Gossypium australe]
MLFKFISMIVAGSGREGSYSATYSHVVRTGVPKAHGGRRNRGLIQIPFLLIVLGTVGLGGLNATRGLNSEFINLLRAYRKQKEACPSHNPFLP